MYSDRYFYNSSFVDSKLLQCTYVRSRLSVNLLNLMCLLLMFLDGNKVFSVKGSLRTWFKKVVRVKMPGAKIMHIVVMYQLICWLIKVKML